jgi:hypothetical protein
VGLDKLTVLWRADGGPILRGIGYIQIVPTLLAQLSELGLKLRNVVLQLDDLQGFVIRRFGLDDRE